jgi:hypothetical protein
VGTKVVRTQSRGRFAAIPNAVLRDPNISDRARGLLCRMLSHADGHGPAAANDLAAGTREGRDAVRAALKELEAAGYLVRRQVRQVNGQTVTETTVFDVPQTPGEAVGPGTGSQSLAGPAETDVPAGGASDGKSGAGSDVQERGSSQVTPETGSQSLAGAGETGVSAGGTSDGFSGAYQKTREHQEKKTKKISRAAQEREAARRLRARYGGLTDSMVSAVFEVAYGRSERAGRPVRDLWAYLGSWAEGDLADVVAAAMDVEREPEPTRSFEALPGGASPDAAPSGTQMTTLHALPDEPDESEPGPASKPDLRDLPAAAERAAAHAALKEIQTRYRNRTTRGTGT